LKLPLEKALSEALIQVRSELDQIDSPAEHMTVLATLRAPIDAFFEAVIVNDPDADVRDNRLRLLQDLCELFQRVADFSKLEG
jgi:glycyl-tRNA synthetase beta chain